LRKQVVEPVFGQIKQARGFRQFLLRGVEKVCAEWAMICTTHNLTRARKPRAAPRSKCLVRVRPRMKQCSKFSGFFFPAEKWPALPSAGRPTAAAGPVACGAAG
jgi:Transposase DDE domain